MGIRNLLGVGLALLLWGSTATRGAMLDVGTHDLLENTIGQVIEIHLTASPGDLTAGIAFNAQIGDGHSGPSITAVDIVGPGTLFSASNTTQRGVGSFAANGFPGLWEAVTTTQAPTLLVPEGLLARVTVDTTGFFFGSGPFGFVLSSTLNNQTNFGVAPPSAPDTTLMVNDGQINIVIPEPATLVLLAPGGLVLMRRRDLDRKSVV